MDAIKNMQNMQLTFYCKDCDYGCSRKSSWEQHKMTGKHQKAMSGLTNANKKYACNNCGAEFKHQPSLSRHRKSCQVNSLELINKISDEKDNLTDKDLILMLVKQNSELMELLKNGTNNTINTNTNCMNNNKTFNLQFFLNETCKDAMNINDFVDSIKVQLCDLERFGEIGYVENLSNIITTNLKALDVTERPVHCTDKKRETIYIKDEDKWEKEDDNRSKLRKAIKKIASKNYKLLPEYREKYPGCQYADSKYSDKYNKMVVEAMGGTGNECEKEDKIIRNISKNITIDKQEI